MVFESGTHYVYEVAWAMSRALRMATSEIAHHFRTFKSVEIFLTNWVSDIDTAIQLNPRPKSNGKPASTS